MLRGPFPSHFAFRCGRGDDVKSAFKYSESLGVNCIWLVIFNLLGQNMHQSSFIALLMVASAARCHSAARAAARVGRSGSGVRCVAASDSAIKFQLTSVSFKFCYSNSSGHAPLKVPRGPKNFFGPPTSARGGGVGAVEMQVCVDT